MTNYGSPTFNFFFLTLNIQENLNLGLNILKSEKLGKE